METMTLEKLKGMGRQEIFEYVAEHLIKQKKPAIDLNSGICAYRGPCGTRCAVGALIPDNLYHKRFESWSVYDIIDKLRNDFSSKPHMELAQIFEDNVTFLYHLQSLHDGSAMYTSSELRDATATVAPWDYSTYGYAEFTLSLLIEQLQMIGEHFDLDTTFLVKLEQKYANS